MGETVIFQEVKGSAFSVVYVAFLARPRIFRIFRTMPFDKELCSYPIGLEQDILRLENLVI